MKRYYCTYFDRNYLTRALSLLESLNKHEKKPFLLFCVCLDEFSRIILNRLSLPNVKVMSISEIEYGDKDLLATRENRSLVEYYWTATPTIILRLLERNPEIDILTYLDSDLFFFSSPDPIFKEISDNNVLIHPHRFPDKHKRYEEAGIFNVGLLSFRRNPEGILVLKDWREKCIEWCYHRMEKDRFGDQKYLDVWPDKFPKIKVSLNPGVGTAPWNQEQYLFNVDSEGCPTVNNTKVVFFHFHNYKIYNAGLFNPITNIGYCYNIEIIKYCYLPYSMSISNCILILQNIYPDFNFGLSADLEYDLEQSFIIHNSIIEHLKHINFPQKKMVIHNDWKYFAGIQLSENNPVVTS